MEKSICTFAFIPVRKDPAEQSEMVTQLLFGESFDVMATEEKWMRIKSHVDGYEGWVDAKLVKELSSKEVERWQNAAKWRVPGPFVKVVSEPDKTAHIISGGSQVFLNGTDRGSFVIGSREFYVSSNYNVDKQPGSIADIAMAFINAPYLWGGKSFFGIDCSGLVQVVFAITGTVLPRDASQQVNLGEIVSFVEEAKAGDLAFFDNEEGQITHVGICLGKGEIIHASGSVRVDKFDHQGIVNSDTKKYSHKLRVIKRIL